MEIVCPGCGMNVAKILLGSDSRHYAKCLECGVTTPIEPPQPAQPAAPAPAPLFLPQGRAPANGNGRLVTRA
ncbi:MAG TPA: hypothetical protein VLV76_19330 [Candidatus Acidoferrum sp.]|nr:hypothetical protein [Candidatus Acidoferrum sp.]